VRLTPATSAQFMDSPVINGPGGLAEDDFKHDLASLGIRYRVLRIGLIDAVIPKGAVSFSEVNLIPSSH
jgi:hypothetical protein